MKKQYISPAFFIQNVELQNFVCGSVTGVGGNVEDITNGGTEGQQTQGDSRRRDLWYDEEEEEEKW